MRRPERLQKAHVAGEVGPVDRADRYSVLVEFDLRRGYTWHQHLLGEPLDQQNAPREHEFRTGCVEVSPKVVPFRIRELRLAGREGRGHRVQCAQNDQVLGRSHRDDVRAVRRDDGASLLAVPGEEPAEHSALEVRVQVGLGFLDRDQGVLDLAL